MKQRHAAGAKSTRRSSAISETHAIGRNRQAKVRSFLALLAAGAMFEQTTQQAQAASYTWGNIGATFSFAGNWIGGVAPISSTTADIAIFQGVPGVQPTFTAAYSLGAVDFQSPGWTFSGSTLTFGTGVTVGANIVQGIQTSTAATGSVTINNALSFSNSMSWNSSLDVALNGAFTVGLTTGTTRTLTFNGSTAAATTAGNITFNNTADFNSNASGPATRLVTIGGIASVTYNGSVGQTSGTVSLTKTGSGVLTLLGSNTYLGSTTFDGGTLVIASEASLGPAPAAFSATKIGVTASSSLRLIPTAGSITFSGNRGVTLSAGTWTVDTNGATNSLNLTAPVIGSGRLFKEGTGTLILSASNSFSGTIGFSAGTLSIANDNALGTGTLRFDGGTLISTAPRTISNPVTLNLGSTISGDQPITFASPFQYVGTTDRFFNVSSTAVTTLNGGIVLSSTAPRSVTMSGTGSTTINGPITETPGFPGRFVISNTGVTTLASTSNSFSGGIAQNDSVGTGVVIISSDNALGSGTYTWSGGTLQSPSARTLTNPVVLTSGGVKVIGSDITFTGPVSVNSGTLAVSQRNLSVATGATGVLAGVISDTDGSGLAKIGGGTLELSGSNTYTGGTSPRNGILKISSDANLGAAAGSIIFDGGTLLTSTGITSSRAVSTTALGGTIDTGAANSTFGSAVSGLGAFTKTGSGKLTIGGVRGTALSVSAGTLAIATGRSTAATSIATNVTLAGTPALWTSTLNLADQDLIIDYDPLLPSPLSTVQSQIASGYASGAWTGTGIDSSSAALTTGSAHPKALGYAEASTLGVGTFSGQTLADTSAVLVRYTYSGDATLDGTVGTSDFTALATAFNATGKLWSDGDFNFDGKVNLLDFNILASNYGQTLPGDLPTGVALGALVPEPASIALLSLAGFLSRRRRR